VRVENCHQAPKDLCDRLQRCCSGIYTLACGIVGKRLSLEPRGRSVNKYRINASQYLNNACATSSFFFTVPVMVLALLALRIPGNLNALATCGLASRSGYVLLEVAFSSE
jgi:hypothetical protein